MTTHNDKLGASAVAEKPDFYGLGIAPKLLSVLEEKKFKNPTPIQFKSIPVTIEGKDIVGIAQTGTGKTLAFGIPMIQRLAQFKGRGLVMLPTRELALQVDEHLRMIGQKLGLRTAVLIGGEAISRQFQMLKRNPHIIIATPGRLIDHLEHSHFNLRDVKILVLDEADMMFDMGFAPQIEKILKAVPKERQTMLFSATMPPAIMRIVTKHMTLPINIEVAPAGTPAELVIQEMIVVKNEEKIVQLQKTLEEYSGSVLVFSRTKHNAKRLNTKINDMGHKSAEIHSNRSLAQRREALSGFKNGKYRVLVATDIAARGIDVNGIELVINFDLPDNNEDYVHRIGRTGRAGKAGRAISFVLPAQLGDIRGIEKLIKKNIPVTRKSAGVEEGAKALKNQPQERPEPRQGRFGRRPERGGRRPERRERPGRERRSYDVGLVTAFNPFKDEGPRQDRKAFGKKGGKRSNRFSRAGRSGGKPAHPQEDRNLTDRQRYRKALMSRAS